MAENLDDGEFWLPSEFLSEDILMEKESRGVFKSEEDKGCFPYEFPYGFDSSESSLSSPVESLVGSTETESDEEDYLAGLTRQMAQSMLVDDEKFVSPAFWNDEPKTKALAGSPQSTLCEVTSWSRCSNGSSQASPNGPSQVSSPPATPVEQKQDAWDLLYAAAGQVVRMKMSVQGLKSHNRGVLGPPCEPVPSPVAAPVKPPSTGYYSAEALNHLQMQHNQFQLLKKQQLMKQQCSPAWGKEAKLTPTMQYHQQQFQSRASIQQQHQQQLIQNRGRSVGFGGQGRCGRSVEVSSPWSIPQSQQHLMPGSGMRAVFLDGSGSKKGSSGTGVFLPRRVGNPAEFRRKPACSTVLVPARVVQALNLNLDEKGSAQPRFQGRFFHDHESMVGPRSSHLVSQQQRSVRPHPASPGNYEIRLPQEWTY